jgi:hypothetical protein
MRKGLRKGRENLKPPPFSPSINLYPIAGAQENDFVCTPVFNQMRNPAFRG